MHILLNKISTLFSSVKTTTGKGVALFAISHFLFIISGYIIHFGLGRLLKPTLYGSYSVVISIVSAILIIVSNGIPKASTKFISENTRNYHTVKRIVFRLQLFLGIILFALLYLSSGKLSIILGDPSLKNLIQISAFVIPIYAIYTILLSFLNSFKLFKRQTFASISYYFSKPLFIFLLVFSGFSINGAIWGFNLAPLVGIIISIIFIKKIKINSSLNIIRNIKVREIVLFSFPLVLYSILYYLSLNIDLLFVKGLISDPAQVGRYSAVSNISRAPTYLSASLISAILPVASQSIFNNEIKKTNNYLNKSIYILIIGSVLYCLLILFFSKDILKLLYSGDYYLAYNSLKILVIGSSFFAVYNLGSMFITALGKPNVIMLIGMLALVSSSILNYLLIPRYELVGAAISTTIVGFFACILTFAYIFKKLIVK